MDGINKEYMDNQKKNYYVIVKGQRPGIYTKWHGIGQAKQQIEGFTNPVYRGFVTIEEAIDWLRGFQIQYLAPDLVDHILDANSALKETFTESVNGLLNKGKIVVFVKGIATGYQGLGGYGVVLMYKENRKELSGGFRTTDSSRMELVALIEAFKALKRKSEVVLYCESRDEVDALSLGWAQRWKSNNWTRSNYRSVENEDLWEQLLALCGEHDVEYRWLEDPSISIENERCSKLALEAAQGDDLPVDTVFESKWAQLHVDLLPLE